MATSVREQAVEERSRSLTQYVDGVLRPELVTYRRALRLEEAAAEVRRCRGTPFSPAVVDAFFAASRRHPSLFEPDDPSYGIAATG